MMKFAAIASLLLLSEGARVKKGKGRGKKGKRAASGATGGGGGVSALGACGSKGGAGNFSMTIVNGAEADSCEWKWQVGLNRYSSGLPFCGGMLISPEWVLTAAHCMGASSFNVIAGDWKPEKSNDNRQVRKMAQFFKHPKYNSRTFDHDFALVKLESPMEFGQCVGSVCLPENDVPAETSCWITGWGTLYAGGRRPDTLQEAKVETLSNAACKATSYRSSQITDSMLCAQGKTKSGKTIDACQGDSGGPLVCETDGKWSIYGATSWGRGCAGASYPGIWARVHTVLGWISEVTSSN